MSRMRADVIAEIRTARDEARIKANAYRNLTAKEYDYWRATAALNAYNQALEMFIAGTEHYIQGMVTIAIAEFEYERDSDIPEMNLAVLDGRRDALASVADWMYTKEGNS